MLFSATVRKKGFDESKWIYMMPDFPYDNEKIYIEADSIGEAEEFLHKYVKEKDLKIPNEVFGGFFIYDSFVECHNVHKIEKGVVELK